MSEESLLTDSAKQARRTACKFEDILSGFGLEQHVKGATHCRGHTLDLLITRSADSVLRSAPIVDTMFSLGYHLAECRLVPLGQVPFRKNRKVHESHLSRCSHLLGQVHGLVHSSK